MSYQSCACTALGADECDLLAIYPSPSPPCHYSTSRYAGWLTGHVPACPRLRPQGARRPHPHARRRDHQAGRLPQPLPTRLRKRVQDPRRQGEYDAKAYPVVDHAGMRLRPSQLNQPTPLPRDAESLLGTSCTEARSLGLHPRIDIVHLSASLSPRSQRWPSCSSICSPRVCCQRSASSSRFPSQTAPRRQHISPRPELCWSYQRVKLWWQQRRCLRFCLWFWLCQSLRRTAEYSGCARWCA